MARIARIWRLAPLLAALLLGGCVNDVTAPPEGTNLLWEKVAYPGRQRVDCMAIDPDGRVLLGVYNYEWNTSHDVGTVCISSDNGETWAKKQVGTFEIVNLAVDSEGRIFAEGFERIMRSRDHGESWEALSFHHEVSSGLMLVVDSGDNLYLETGYDGILFSNDHGDSWTQIGDSIIAAGELTSLAVNSRGCLFAIADQKLFRSCDRGASWAELRNVPWENLYELQVAIDSGDRVFIVCSSKVYRSTDDGETWLLLAQPVENAWVDKVSIDGSGRLYSMCSSRIFASGDGGDSWALILSLWNNYPRCVASNAEGDIFAAGRWGVSRSTDDGASWEMLGFTEYEPAAVVVDGNGYLYVGAECGGVYRSSDSLESWERFNAGLPDVGLNCLSSLNESILIAGTTNGVYRSPKDRPAWSLAGLAGSNARKVFAFPGDSVAALARGLLRISTDGGNNWSDLGLSGYEITTLIRTADGSLFAGASFGGVFRYTGQGILWDQMNNGLGDLRVNALAVTRGGALLAGTNTGIFVSSNGGVSWRRFSKEQYWITTVLVVDEDIFFGTSKGVLWTRTDGSALSLQNGGIPPSNMSGIRSIAADHDDRLFLFMGRYIFRSSQSTKELLR